MRDGDSGGRRGGCVKRLFFLTRVLIALPIIVGLLWLKSIWTTDVLTWSASTANTWTPYKGAIVMDGAVLLVSGSRQPSRESGVRLRSGLNVIAGRQWLHLAESGSPMWTRGGTLAPTYGITIDNCE